MTKRDDWSRYSRREFRRRRRDLEDQEVERSMFERLEEGVRMRRDNYDGVKERGEPESEQLWDAA